MIVVGSRALNYHMTPGHINDLDIVGTYDEANAFRRAFGAVSFFPINNGNTLFMRNAKGFICEFDIAWPGSRAEGFLKFAENNPLEFESTAAYGGKAMTTWLVPSPNVLYMLKMSHRYLKDSQHFLKTMRDIKIMREAGFTITQDIHHYYRKRMAETYTYAHPKLAQSKEGFFDAEATGVKYTYDHDSIHEAVKWYYKPAYAFFKPKDSPVMCDKGMFFDAPINVRLQAVLEESYVLALERSLIPFPGKKTPKEAFDMALMKVCTSITSGWFREFAWTNYDAVQELYATRNTSEDNFVNLFEVGLQSGRVKPTKE